MFLVPPHSAHSKLCMTLGHGGTQSRKDAYAAVALEKLLAPNPL